MHQHRKFIDAFLDGRAAEFKQNTLDSAWDKWEKVLSLGTFDYPNLMFRVVPNKMKTVGYRRYVYKINGKRFVGTFDEESGCTAKRVESFSAFVKWVDLDWQYAEYEVEE